MTHFLAALGATLVFTGATIPLLRRAQFMDVPNRRSSHVAPVPRGGGFAVVASIVAVAVAGGELPPRHLVLLGVIVGMAAIGLADDARSLAAAWRLAAQAVAGLVVSASAIQQGMDWWQAPAVLLLVMAYVNAFNFMDGINGISAMTAAVAGAWWWWVGSTEDISALGVLGAVQVGAALGFLPWNAPVARVFLGDVGSYGLGSLIVVMSAIAVLERLDLLMALAPMVLYLADTGWVLIKRAHAGRPLTEPHREHVYQRLVDQGWPHLASAGLCASVGAGVCLASLLALRGLTLVAIGLIALLAVGYLCAPTLFSPLAGRGGRSA